MKLFERNASLPVSLPPTQKTKVMGSIAQRWDLRGWEGSRSYIGKIPEKAEL